MTAVIALHRRFTSFFERAAAASDTLGAVRMRRGLALMFAAYSVALTVAALVQGNSPHWGYILILMGALALWMNRGGRFIRDWFPVLLGLFAYRMAGTYAEKLKLDVHYLPQLDADKVLGLGGLPTTWLQHHLYHGTTGPLEVGAVLVYVSHFFVPLFFAFYLWWTQRRGAFTALMFGLLVTSVLAEITFVATPTAPPWMAADHGLIPPVHHIFKQTLLDLHLNSAAAFVGDPSKYNTVAAMPSLHAAWPIVGLLVTLRYGLPRWTTAVLAVQWSAIVFAVVYMGEHYVSDAIVGAGYAAVASWLVLGALGRPLPGRVSDPVPTGMAQGAGAARVVPPFASQGLAHPAGLIESTEG